MQLKNMKRMLLISAATLIIAAVSASAADVKETWGKSCAKCHGPDGKGETKIGKKIEVKDFTDAKVQASFKDEDMIKAIKEGIKDGEKIRMKPAEGVTDDDVKALVAYVRGLKKG
jgi:cytochrome c553